MATNEYIPEDNTVQFSSPDEYYKSKGDEVDDTGLTGTEKIKIIKQAQKRAKCAHSYWDDKYSEMEKDWDFYDGTDQKQWSTDAITKRSGLPILTFNQLPKFVSKITAESKKNPPSIKLAPRENGDKLKADIGMGIVRYIEDSCGAKYAYTNALQAAAIGGLGWVKVTYDDSRIIVKKVKDPFSWMIDPDSEESDGSDAKFVISHSRKKEGKKIVECFEYWWKEEGSVFWAIIEGNEVLEYGEFPSKYIPIVPVYGIDIQYKENRTVKGIVRDLRDPQSSYNWFKSKEMETIAMAPKPFVMMPAGQAGDNIKDWHNVNVNVVEYNTTDNGNNQVGRPDLSTAIPNVGYLSQVAAESANDLKEVSGIYDTALGADSKVMSGAAIVAKSANSEAGQYNFTENLQNSLQQIGRVVISLIKPIMGNQRIFRVLGEDGQQAVVDSGVPQVDPITGQPTMVDFDFDDMDISVSSAPAYATRRDAGAQAIQDIMTAIPEKAGLLADLAVANLDVPGAAEAAKRLKLTLPPEMQQSDPGMIHEAMADQIMQQSQAIIMQQAQVIDTLKKQLATLQTQMNNDLTMAMVTEQQRGQTALAKEAMVQAGNDRRKAMDLESKDTSDNKKILADAQKTNAQITAAYNQQASTIFSQAQAQEKKNQSELAKTVVQNQKPDVPNSLSITNTKVEAVPDQGIKVVGVLPGNTPSATVL